MGNRSQISLEYLIITGFVVFAILIPSFLILFSSTNRGVQDTVTNQKTVDLGKGLVNDAKQMYYLGVYSRKISTYEIPENVENMFILTINNTEKEYFYFGIVMNDGKQSNVQTFLSDIPLTSYESDNVQLDPSLEILVTECAKPGYTCKFYGFTGSVIKPGNKRFKVETVWRDGRNRKFNNPALDMKMQKKSQISFEYIIIFSFILLLFLVAGSVIVLGLEKTKTTQSESEYLAKQIKVAVITASLSRADFKTQIEIPESISGVKIYVDIYESPDNILLIKKDEYNPDVPEVYESLAREFLPIISSSDIRNFADGALIIEKKDGLITISQE